MDKVSTVLQVSQFFASAKARDFSTKNLIENPWVFPLVSILGVISLLCICKATTMISCLRSSSKLEKGHYLSYWHPQYVQTLIVLEPVGSLEMWNISIEVCRIEQRLRLQIDLLLGFEDWGDSHILSQNLFSWREATENSTLVDYPTWEILIWRNMCFFCLTSYLLNAYNTDNL